MLVALVAFDNFAEAVGSTVVSTSYDGVVGVVLVSFEFVDAVDEFSLAGLSVAKFS